MLAVQYNHKLQHKALLLLVANSPAASVCITAHGRSFQKLSPFSSANNKMYACVCVHARSHTNHQMD